MHALAGGGGSSGEVGGEGAVAVDSVEPFVVVAGGVVDHAPAGGERAGFVVVPVAGYEHVASYGAEDLSPFGAAEFTTLGELVGELVKSPLDVRVIGCGHDWLSPMRTSAMVSLMGSAVSSSIQE
jgi:hypothetical protein